MCVKIKYLAATAGAINIHIGVPSDLAMLGSNKLKVVSIGKMFANSPKLITWRFRAP